MSGEEGNPTESQQLTIRIRDQVSVYMRVSLCVCVCRKVWNGQRETPLQETPCGTKRENDVVLRATRCVGAPDLLVFVGRCPVGVYRGPLGTAGLTVRPRPETPIAAHGNGL
jgi:hypothetical protein